jgi:hypothetical protein
VNERTPHQAYVALQRLAREQGRTHRDVGLHALEPLLETLRESRQRSWAAFRARVGLDGLPERFSDVVDAVVAFLDGLAADGVMRWSPAEERWI